MGRTWGSIWVGAGLATLVGLVPGQANATCMLTCEAALVNSDCTLFTEADWPSDERPRFTGSCTTTCCAPPSEEHPNGSCSDTVEDLDPSWLVIADPATGAGVPGTFSQVPGVCKPLEFSTLLEPG